MRFPEASGLPYDCNTRENAHSRSVVKAIRDQVLRRKHPKGISETFYMVQERNGINADGLLTSSYVIPECCIRARIV